MCLLILKPAGQKVPAEHLDNARRRNDDGYGVAWIHRGRVHVLRGTDPQQWTEWRDFVARLTAPAIIHLRLRSRGPTTIDATHPVPIDRMTYLAHNGTLHGLGSSEQSDTQELASMLRDMAPGTRRRTLQLLGRCTGQHFALISPAAGLEYFGPLTFHHNEILYSNESWRPIKTLLHSATDKHHRWPVKLPLRPAAEDRHWLPWKR